MGGHLIEVGIAFGNESALNTHREGASIHGYHLEIHTIDGEQAGIGFRFGFAVNVLQTVHECVNSLLQVGEVLIHY